MQWNKAVPAIVVVFLWYLIWDNFLSSAVMGSAVAQIPGMTESYSKMWETIGNLFAAAVLVWVWSKVHGSFGATLKGGLTYGLYAGVLMNFPGWLWMTVYGGWPYAATWHIVLVLIVLTVVSGALIGLVYEKMGSPKTMA